MSQMYVTTVSPQELQFMIIEALREFRPQQSVPKKLLSGKDVEIEFGLSHRTLENWRTEGIGPTYTMINRRIFYEREVLEAFIAGGRVQTTGKV